MIFASVALGGCHEVQGTVSMLLVVPLLEASHPLAGLLQVVKGFVWKATAWGSGLALRYFVGNVSTQDLTPPTAPSEPERTGHRPHKPHPRHVVCYRTQGRPAICLNPMVDPAPLDLA